MKSRHYKRPPHGRLGWKCVECGAIKLQVRRELCSCGGGMNPTVIYVAPPERRRVAQAA